MEIDCQCRSGNVCAAASEAQPRSREEAPTGLRQRLKHYQQHTRRDRCSNSMIIGLAGDENRPGGVQLAVATLTCIAARGNPDPNLRRFPIGNGFC
eukprot:3933531-Rhodomonas_salina.2